MRTAPKDLEDKMIVIKGLSSQIEKSIIETYVSVIKIVFGHNKTDISRRETSTPTKTIGHALKEGEQTLVTTNLGNDKPW